MKRAQSRIGHLAAASILPGVLALAGCGSSNPAPKTQATVPTTTVSAASSYGIPTRITVPYVQRVINALNAVQGDAARLIVADRSLVPPAVYRLEAIDGDKWFSEVTATWADDLAAGLKNYRSAPGNEKDTVKKLISASPSCMWVETISDFSAVAVKSPPPSINYIQLIPLMPGRDKGGWNPTPWMIQLEGYNSRGLTPSDPCASAT